MSVDPRRAHLLRLVGSEMNDVLVKATESLDMTTREQIVSLSMLFGSVIAMSHIPEAQAREMGQQMIDAALMAVHAFQRATQS